VKRNFSSQKYSLKFHKSVKKKDLKRFSVNLKEELKPHLYKLKQDPYLPKPLKGIFKGLRSYYFTSAGTNYRIIYEILEDEKQILILMIGSREGLYERLRKRLSL